MALFRCRVSIRKRLQRNASSKSNVHTPPHIGLWPWFGRINWKNYHSIISICATSLCKGEKRSGGEGAGEGVKSDKAHLQETGAKRTWPGECARCVTLKWRAEWVILWPHQGFSGRLETHKWPPPPCAPLLCKQGMAVLLCVAHWVGELKVQRGRFIGRKRMNVVLTIYLLGT